MATKKKKEKITLTKIRKIAQDCVFNPKDDLTMKFVVELNDPEYCITKAQELLSSGQSPIAKINQAIRLLYLAKAQLDGAL